MQHPSDRVPERRQQRLLACLAYEAKHNLIEADNAPSDIFDRLLTLTEKAPPSVAALVQYLEANPPEEKDGVYSYALPVFQWKT